MINNVLYYSLFLRQTVSACTPIMRRRVEHRCRNNILSSLLYYSLLPNAAPTEREGLKIQGIKEKEKKIPVFKHCLYTVPAYNIGTYIILLFLSPRRLLIRAVDCCYLLLTMV